jgi:co-chaperonin GroES (HSP10)
MKAAFPDVHPGIIPFGYNVLLQLRTPKVVSRGGIIIPDDARDAERFRVQTGLVRAFGPSAFRNRNTMESWPEGAWCSEGDFVRCPLYGGDRWLVPLKDYENKEDVAVFIICKDTDLIGLVMRDPLDIVTS